MEKKYYFITYQAKRIGQPINDYWNTVIDVSPMEFIMSAKRSEEESERSYYKEFVITSVLEISYTDFQEFDGQF